MNLFANESKVVMDFKFESLLALMSNSLLVGFIVKLYDKLLARPEKRRRNLVPAA